MNERRFFVESSLPMGGLQIEHAAPDAPPQGHARPFRGCAGHHVAVVELAEGCPINEFSLVSCVNAANALFEGHAATSLRIGFDDFERYVDSLPRLPLRSLDDPGEPMALDVGGVRVPFKVSDEIERGVLQVWFRG